MGTMHNMRLRARPHRLPVTGSAKTVSKQLLQARQSQRSASSKQQPATTTSISQTGALTTSQPSEKLDTLHLSSEPNTMTEPFTTFHVFKKLPVELRKMIWEEGIKNLPGRVILLDFELWNLQSSEEKNLIDPRGYGHQVLPPFCEICSEAKRTYERYRAVTEITLFMENPLDIKQRGCFRDLQGFARVAKSTPITVNPSKDFVVFAQETGKHKTEKFAELIGPDNCGKIRHIGKIGGPHRVCHQTALQDLSDFEKLFPNVETCSIINRNSLQIVLEMQRDVYTLVPDTITDYSGIVIRYPSPLQARGFYSQTTGKDLTTLFPKHKAMQMEKF